MFALYIAEDDSASYDESAWNYGVDQDEALATIKRVMDSWGDDDSEELVIRVKIEER